MFLLFYLLFDFFSNQKFWRKRPCANGNFSRLKVTAPSPSYVRGYINPIQYTNEPLLVALQVHEHRWRRRRRCPLY